MAKESGFVEGENLERVVRLAFVTAMPEKVSAELQQVKNVQLSVGTMKIGTRVRVTETLVGDVNVILGMDVIEKLGGVTIMAGKVVFGEDTSVMCASVTSRSMPLMNSKSKVVFGEDTGVMCASVTSRERSQRSCQELSTAMRRLEAQEHKLLVGNEVKTVEKRVNGVDKKFVENDMKRMCNDVKEVKADVKDHSKGINDAKKAVTEFKEIVLELKEECIDLEGRGRQKNVLFHGVKEEDREDCILLAKRIIREECKVNKPVIIERAHRVGKSRIEV